MFTSWSEVSTPAELSMASVLRRTPALAASIRPSWVKPRLPPSPTTRARICSPSMRMASLALSPTSALDSVEALTYVPIPPFQSRSTGAVSTARMSSCGVMATTSGAMPRASRTSGVSTIDLVAREWTPPPAEMRSGS